MTKYTVKVQNSDGTIDLVSVDATGANEAMELLNQQGRLAIDAVEEPEKSISFSFGRVPDTELYHFTRLFATLTRAGVPILETLEMLVDRVNNSVMRQGLREISQSVKSGTGLTPSFAKQSKIFDKTYLQLLEVGEESGNLPQVLERITTLLRKRIQLRSMIVKALTYPMLVMVLSAVVVSAILIKIVPRFKDIYSKFGGELPFITKMTLGASDVLIGYFPIVLVAAVTLFVFFTIGKKTAFGKRIYDRLILGLPLLGQMFHTYEIAGFSKSFSMLVHSGITVTGALDLIQHAVERYQISEALRIANDSIKNGKSISDSFDAQAPWLPELLNRMVAVGERSGNLPEMLDHVADFYEEEFNNKVETLASLIEPLLIVFLGVVIGGIVVSLYLPIFGMARLISQR